MYNSSRIQTKALYLGRYLPSCPKNWAKKDQCIKSYMSSFVETSTKINCCNYLSIVHKSVSWLNEEKWTQCFPWCRYDHKSSNCTIYCSKRHQSKMFILPSHSQVSLYCFNLTKLFFMRTAIAYNNLEFINEDSLKLIVSSIIINTLLVFLGSQNLFWNQL